jgi:tetratricopeptide (TPR) repeat protein
MDCETIRRRQIVDEYAAGRLSIEEAEEYEKHYFSCDGCFDQLRHRDHLARFLKAHGPALFSRELAAETARARGVPRARGGAFPVPEWLSGLWAVPWARGLAAATVILIAGLLTYQDMQRARSWKSICSPQAYPYAASELRGRPAPPGLVHGMELYTASRYEEAAVALDRASRAAPDDAEIAFYLGLALLMSGRDRPALEALRQAGELVPASRLYRWYLAQALVRTGQRTAAEAELEQLAAVGPSGAGGEYAAEAQMLLRQVRAVHR